MKTILAVTLALALSAGAGAQCTNNCQVDAGPNKTSVCPGSNVILGVTNCTTGGASGCTYSISWTPSSLVVSGQGTCKPTVNPTVTTKFYMTVKMHGNCCCSQPTGSCAASTCDTIIKKDSATVTVNNSGCRLMEPLMQGQLNDARIGIYPNPASGEVNVDIAGEYYKSISESGMPMILLYDQSGRLLMAREAEEAVTRLLINDLPRGNYFIRVVSGNSTLDVERIILN